MRFKRRLNFESGLKQISVVAFLNIFFLLVAFLLLVCGFVDTPGVPVNFPRLVTSRLLTKDTLRVTVTSEGLFLIDGVVRTAPQVRDLFSALPAGRVSLVVQFQEQAPAEAIMQLWGICREAGISGLSLARTDE